MTPNTSVGHAKCADCLSRKGKRSCGRNAGRLVCSECCGRHRSWRSCPVECTYFPAQPGPAALFGGIVATMASGEGTAGIQNLYLPNLYEYVVCAVHESSVQYLDSQRALLRCAFQLSSEAATGRDQFLCKDEWKSRFFPPGRAELDLYPLVGVAFGELGLPDLETLRLSPACDFRVAGNDWVIVPPHQRPMFLMGPDGKPDSSPVLSMGIRNAMVFAPLRFDVEYALEVVAMDLTSMESSGELTSQVGFVSPFGRVEMCPPRVTPPPDSVIRGVTQEVFAPVSGSEYPGERLTDNGTEALVLLCRQHRKSMQGEVISRVSLAEKPIDGVYSFGGPCSRLLTIGLKPSGPVQASLLQHSRQANAKLIPTLRHWLGPMGCPFQLALMNSGDAAQAVVVMETNQATGRMRKETLTLAPLTLMHTALELPGLGSDSSGELSLAVQVVASGVTVLDTVASLTLLPTDHLMLRIEDSVRDWYRDTVEAVACWVTPHSRAVDEWVSDARHACPNGLGAGSRSPVEEQLDALWEVLGSRQMTYINRNYSIDTGSSASYQRVLTPSETLRLASGNCIDLTVLFASALEQLGYWPLILTTMNHAFLGWLGENGDVAGVIETTMVGNTDSATAIQSAATAFGSLDRFKKAGGRAIAVHDARDKGLMPLFE